MCFALLPPEINSARMYSGPGSGPMLLAAAAWDQLAAELHAAGAAYRSVIANLTTSGWQGPSSMMMENAIAPYVAWMHSTGAQAEQTAGRARVAAGAYLTAFAMTVPPPLIAANRGQLQALVATNFFGQNSPAIAATEANYEQMWAQDAAAMYGYAAAAATASKLLPFANPPAATNAVALAAPAVAPAQASIPSLATLLLQIPSLTSASASISSSSFGGGSIATTNHAVAVNALRDDYQGIGPFLAWPDAPAAPAGPVTVTGSATSAVMGRASLVGTLSVPQTWSATTAVSPAALATPAVSAAAAPAVAIPGTGMFGEALLGSMAGRGVSNAAAKARRPSVIPRPPAAG